MDTDNSNNNNEDNSKGVIVVPSLETKMMAGRYKLYFMAIRGFEDTAHPFFESDTLFLEVCFVQFLV